MSGEVSSLPFNYENTVQEEAKRGKEKKKKKKGPFSITNCCSNSPSGFHKSIELQLCWNADTHAACLGIGKLNGVGNMGHVAAYCAQDNIVFAAARFFKYQVR